MRTAIAATNPARTLVLWDIDNTLLYTGGAGSRGMTRAFRALYGIDDAFARVEFSGRTDAAIFRDAGRLHAIDGIEEQALLTNFLDAYVAELQTALHEPPPGRLMPGIERVLDAMGAHDDIVMGLGTGNFRRSGELKLQHYGIADHFPGCVGGFGEDSEQRADVIRLAIERLSDGNGRPQRVVVIGDTPHDVSAALANGAIALGVATGEDSVDVLRAAGAHYALDDLSDTERVLACITDTAATR